MDAPIQYIPRNMHTVFALLCFVVVIHWLIIPYPSGLLHWHCGNLTIAPVPAKQPWLIWINTSCEFFMNDCITTTKQSTTKPCAYFLGYTVAWFIGSQNKAIPHTMNKNLNVWILARNNWIRCLLCFNKRRFKKKNIPLLLNLCICTEAFEKIYTVYKVILLVSRCCTGLRPPNNYCPPDDVLTMVAGRLSNKPLIGIRYAISRKWKKNAQDRQVGFATYVTPPISIPDKQGAHLGPVGPRWAQFWPHELAIRDASHTTSQEMCTLCVYCCDLLLVGKCRYPQYSSVLLPWHQGSL